MQPTSRLKTPYLSYACVCTLCMPPPSTGAIPEGYLSSHSQYQNTSRHIYICHVELFIRSMYSKMWSLRGIVIGDPLLRPLSFNVPSSDGWAEKYDPFSISGSRSLLLSIKNESCRRLIITSVDSETKVRRKEMRYLRHRRKEEYERND